MTNFCGIISKPSNSVEESPSLIRHQTFTDIHFQANDFCAETNNLHANFCRQSEYLRECDVLLQQNEKEIEKIVAVVDYIKNASIQMEKELDCLMFDLNCAEFNLFKLLKEPMEVECFCGQFTSRKCFYEQFMSLSKDMVTCNRLAIDIQEEEKDAPMKKPLFEMMYPIITTFLQSNLEILEKTEVNLHSLERQIREINDMFSFAYNRQSYC